MINDFDQDQGSGNVTGMRNVLDLPIRAWLKVYNDRGLDWLLPCVNVVDNTNIQVSGCHSTLSVKLLSSTKKRNKLIRAILRRWSMRLDTGLPNNHISM